MERRGLESGNRECGLGMRERLQRTDGKEIWEVKPESLGPTLLGIRRLAAIL
jgi:hypothetical protein